MRVNVYSVNQDTATETFDGVCALWDLFDLTNEDDNIEYIEAQAELREQGRYWMGGGASVLFLLTLVRD